MNELSELPEHVSRVSVEQRRWNGAVVDVHRFYCTGRVVTDLGYSSQDRIGANLEEISKSPTEARWRRNKPCAEGSYSPRQMMLAPAGMEAWGYSEDVRFVNAATLTFAGLAWIGMLTSLNVAAQMASPGWVKARALATSLSSKAP